MLIRRASDLRPVPWRNGLGVTRDVHTELLPDGALSWQVSIADLEADAPFSHFPQCDRVFTPVAGHPPPELAIDGAPFRPCPLLQPVAFSGEVPTLSRIPAPGRAFNLVADRRRWRLSVQVLHLPEDAPVPLPPAATHLLLHCHAGAVRLAAALLHPGDSAVQPDGHPAAAAPGTTLLLAAVSPL